MKKILGMLGIVAICFVGLFTLVSCGTNDTTPTGNESGINEPSVEEIQDRGTVLFDIATAEQTRTYTDAEGHSYGYVYTVMIRALVASANSTTTVAATSRNATKLTQYDNYFVLEYCYIDHGDVFKVVEVYSNTMNTYFYSTL